MMSSQEKTEYARLPRRVTLYRGCSRNHSAGSSWYLARHLAVGFASHRPVCAQDAVLVTARVARSEILAVLFGHAGPEVITFSAEPVNIEFLDELASAV